MQGSKKAAALSLLSLETRSIAAAAAGGGSGRVLEGTLLMWWWSQLTASSVRRRTFKIRPRSDPAESESSSPGSGEEQELQSGRPEQRSNEIKARNKLKRLYDLKGRALAGERIMFLLPTYM